ncbi:glycosyltransferase family 2 protein [Salinilacihabitans rarus]|uniref:glycosyltransferase family 2 protein n=1 Tax=Salinilacihabitans rarus TaxID=2961596 RepID=UPI0020C8FB4D|nr:glycosyltransferase family 2 protein [Salinilacihabitans rarus]
MYGDNTVAVVVPAYNEAGFVGDVIETMPSFVDRIYAVDDRSTDGTWEEIVAHARRPADRRGGEGGEPAAEDDAAAVEASPDAEGAVADGGATGDPAVVPIRHAENRGVGAAIKTGYRRALEDGMDVTAVMAGDGQMDPDQLDRLLDPVVEGRAAYAKGNRLDGSAHRTEMSTWRLFGNLLLTFLTKVASGYWEMLDPQNGYTAISRAALEAVDLDRLYDRYGFANDLLVSLNACGFRIADVSMPAVYGEERSHIRYRSFVPSLSWLLLRGFVRRLGYRYVFGEFHPLALLYALGAAASAAAAAGLAWAVRVRSDADSRIAGVLASVAVLVLGALCLVLGMVFDRDVNEGTVVSVR